jgi:hypothetical protein
VADEHTLAHQHPVADIHSVHLLCVPDDHTDSDDYTDTDAGSFTCGCLRKILREQFGLPAWAGVYDHFRYPSGMQEQTLFG